MAAMYSVIFSYSVSCSKQGYRLLGHVSDVPRPTSALAVVMDYACLVTLDGLVDLADSNFPRSGNGLPLPTNS
jgi:hypothetical protein